MRTADEAPTELQWEDDRLHRQSFHQSIVERAGKTYVTGESFFSLLMKNKVWMWNRGGKKA